MRINEIVIKCATNEDIGALCEFEKQARLTEPDIWVLDFNEALYKEQLGSLDMEKLTNTKVIIAVKDGAIIGRCDAAIMLSLVDFKKTGYIDWIYTLINYRGNGIGKKMLKGAEEYFKSQGVKDYYLFTASNEQAHEFYHRQSDLNFSNREVAEKEIK